VPPFTTLKPGNNIYDDIVAKRDEVFAKHRPIFSADHVANLSKEEHLAKEKGANHHREDG
jgi:hypothetical protein